MEWVREVTGPAEARGAVLALISSGIGALLGHWLSVSEDRRRHRFLALMELDRIIADQIQHLHGGELAHASRLKADLISYSLQTEDPTVWGPVLSFTNAVEQLRENDGAIPPPDSNFWRGYDHGIWDIGRAAAKAKVQAMAAFVRPRWYQRPHVWVTNLRKAARYRLLAWRARRQDDVKRR